MNKILDWIKANKLSTVLLLILGYFLLNFGVATPFLGSYDRQDTYPSSMMESAGFGGMGFAPTADTMLQKGIDLPISPINEVTPQPNVENRKVVTESNVSIVVKEVRGSLDQIQSKAEELGGYMVNASLSSPGETANGWLTVRIPATQLTGFLEYLRSNSIKVVNESVSGTDVTDQYVDMEERLRTLNKTKTIFEGILDSASDVDEIIKVQDRILSVQSQIEYLQGQMQKLDATSSTTLVAINLSTDEYSLPYAPDEPWRPEVVFKLAVRDLVTTFRGLATKVIWLAVYTPIWLPALTIFIVAKAWWKKRQNTQ